MRSLLLTCALSLLACSDQVRSDGSGRSAETTYVCELGDERGLLREGWRDPPESESLNAYSLAQARLLDGFPSELAAIDPVTKISSAKLPQAGRVWLWRGDERVEPAAGDGARAWSLAMTDAQGAITVGPVRVAALRDVFVPRFTAVAVSAANRIALAYSTSSNEGDDLLLIDADGSMLAEVQLPAPGTIRGLQATSTEDFALLTVGRVEGLRTLRFARFDEDGLRELSDPIHESEGLSAQTVQLIANEGGFLALWQEYEHGIKSWLMVRRLDVDGRALDEERELLPTQALFQGTLSWARFEQALALVWVEADEAQLPASEWPHDVERYRFQLISPRDLEPLSALLEITKSDGLMIPKILASQGQLMVYASIAEDASSEEFGLVSEPSAPVAVQCLPEERP